ncbi:hypothetical protein ACFCT7_02760 [Fulvivirgaceae bacterium LMO-SS25]
MKYSISFLLAFGFSLVLFSCGENNQEEVVDLSKKYKLTISDSVIINELSNITLFAVNQEDEKLLIQSRGGIFIYNFEGKELLNFNPYVDGPNFIGPISIDWEFYGKDKLIVYGLMSNYIFSNTGERLSKIDFPGDMWGATLPKYNQKFLYPFVSNNQLKLLTFFPAILGQDRRTQAYFDSLTHAYVYDFQNGTVDPVMYKTADNVYRTENGYLDDGLPIPKKFKDDLFFLTYLQDKFIYLVNASKDEIIKKIEIPTEFQPVHTSVEFSSKDQPDIRRQNARIFALGDKFILRSSTEIPEFVLKEIRTQRNWRSSQEYREARNLYVKSDYLVFDENGFLGKIDVDFSEFTPNFVNSQSGSLWTNVYFRDERDYHKLVQLKLEEF